MIDKETEMNKSFDMKNDLNLNSKRHNIGNIAIVLALVFLTIGCWNVYAWYEVIAPLGTPVSFVFLGVALLCYVDIRDLIKDIDFYLVVIGSIVTIINIVRVRSGYGAFFTAADLLLVLYLANKVKFPRKWIIGISIYIAFFFYYWTFDVKGYYKGYNTNYGGLVLITGFVFALIVLAFLYNYLQEKGKKKWAYAVMAFFVFMFAWGYNIISWYRARCALIGLVVVVFVTIIPRSFLSKKAFYMLLTLGSTIGSIIVSMIYVFLGRVKDYITIKVFYKDILSGRDEIWAEMWGIYFQHPLTGVGSNYQMRLEWMGGMFEVHNGLLDILVVHGLFVFIVVLVLLIKRILQVRQVVAASFAGKMAIAGIFAMLVASFMENFFIVPPFTLCFMLLFIFLGSDYCKETTFGSNL